MSAPLGFLKCIDGVFQLGRKVVTNIGSDPNSHLCLDVCLGLSFVKRRVFARLINIYIIDYIFTIQMLLIPFKRFFFSPPPLLTAVQINNASLYNYVDKS